MGQKKINVHVSEVSLFQVLSKNCSLEKLGGGCSLENGSTVHLCHYIYTSEGISVVSLNGLVDVSTVSCHGSHLPIRLYPRQRPNK